MVRFSLEHSQMRFYGHYAIYVPAEIDRRMFVMAARRFAAIFASVMEGERGYLLATKIGPNSSKVVASLYCTTH